MTIPLSVLQCLEAVRSDDQFNMMARESVIQEMMDRADTWDEAEDYREAALWLYDNKPRYMEALNAMGAARKAGP